MNQKTRELVLERDAWSCLRCGVGVVGRPYSLHHRKGRGSDAPSNLATLCGTGSTGCHGWVHAHPEESYEAGWMIRRLGSDDPALVPVATPLGLLRLDDEGQGVPVRSAS